MGGRSTASWSVQLEGAGTLQKALRILAEPDAPYLRDGLEKAGHVLAGEVSSRAPGGIARTVSFVGIRGNAANLRAVISVKHPGARPMEFGRVWYYRKASRKGAPEGIGNNRAGSKRGRGSMKKQYRYHVAAGRGQKARPYMGIVDGGGAIAASAERVRKILSDAIEREWDRVTAGGGS